MSYIWSGLTSQNRSGVSSFYLYDSQGSVRNLVDAAGAITDTYVYTAFGVELLTGIGTVNPFRYVGLFGYYLESVNLYYVRARWLEVLKGRWDSRDPIGYYGGDFNLYGFVFGNPVIFVDPSGNRGVCCTVKEWLNTTGKDPICLHGRRNHKGEQLAFFGRGCAATTALALKLAAQQCDDGLRRWNNKRESHCQFKHGRVTECETDRGQRGQRSFENCSDAQLVGVCIVTAALIVICSKHLIPVAIKEREKIPAMLGIDDEQD